MNVCRLLYNTAMLPVVAATAPFAYLVSRLLPLEEARRWRQRLGRYGSEAPWPQQPRPLLWLHAVSVGEVGVAAALIEALDRVRPGLGVMVSSTTHRGQEVARRRLAGRAHCIAFPLDVIVSVHWALRHFRPDLLVCLESELWPNLLAESQRLHIPTLLLNGRISQRSLRRYRKVRCLFGPILRNFAALAMISAPDAERIIELGAPAARVVVTGNLKGAGLTARVDWGRARRLRHMLWLDSDQPVLVAGSIRDRELSWLPDIFGRLADERADLVGIFAPRHLNRLGRLQEQFLRRGLAVQRLSRLEAGGAEARRCQVVLVDRMGVLFDLYGLADLVFCGGSLVPLGGQNILEPAAWGKAVFYGPHMDNFLEARELLEHVGCGITVQDPGELLEQLRYYLSRPQELEAMGKRAQAALENRHLVARTQAELIRDALDSRRAPGTGYLPKGS
jgi:3-deoxy-D-manno-octulosonic-acid transferase